MLKCRDLATIRPEKNGPLLTKEYESVYFDFDSTDEVEEFEKTSEKKPIEVDGKTWKGTKPKNDITAVTDEAKISEMVQEALNFVLDKNPTQPDGKTPNNSWLLLLKYARKGFDSETRNNIQRELRPGKPLTEGEAFESVVRTLIRSGKTESQAKKLAAIMMQAESDDAGE